MRNKKVYFLSIIIFFMVVFTVIMSSSLKTNARENSDNNRKVYTSISIETGDTLWDIAEEYKPEEMTCKEYINEIKQINSLSSDDIHSGNYLMVYYIERH